MDAGSDDLFARICERLVPTLNPAKIIAFGSRVRGVAPSTSDLDLIVVEDGGGTLGDRAVRVRGALGSLGVPIDLVVYTSEEFEQQRRWRSSIAAVAEREGRVLHSRDSHA